MNDSTIPRSLVEDLLKAAGINLDDTLFVRMKGNPKTLTITASSVLRHYDGSFRTYPNTGGIITTTETRTFSLTP